MSGAASAWHGHLQRVWGRGSWQSREGAQGLCCPLGWGGEQRTRVLLQGWLRCPPPPPCHSLSAGTQDRGPPSCKASPVGPWAPHRGLSQLKKGSGAAVWPSHSRGGKTRDQGVPRSPTVPSKEQQGQTLAWMWTPLPPSNPPLDPQNGLWGLGRVSRGSGSSYWASATRERQHPPGLRRGCVLLPHSRAPRGWAEAARDTSR